VVAGLVLAAASAIAHDVYVGVLRHGQAVTGAQQVKAARVATVLVGATAILIGVLAEGQNVAILVGLAFAVAASGNFPCLFLTLHWRRTNTVGMVAGMIVGTVAAIGLTLVSPAMTYPLAAKATAQATLDRIATQQTGGNVADAVTVLKMQKDADAARATLQRYAGQDRSMIGLKEPLIKLRNPGIVSIPLGFLAVILGSLCCTERRAIAQWDEVHVRQNIGLVVNSAANH
jgi:cation/acetate symporter